jgi:hypothetical protein
MTHGLSFMLQRLVRLLMKTHNTVQNVSLIAERKTKSRAIKYVYRENAFRVLIHLPVSSVVLWTEAVTCESFKAVLSDIQKGLASQTQST